MALMFVFVLGQRANFGDFSETCLAVVGNGFDGTVSCRGGE